MVIDSFLGIQTENALAEFKQGCLCSQKCTPIYMAVGQSELYKNHLGPLFYVVPQDCVPKS